MTQTAKQKGEPKKTNDKKGGKIKLGERQKKAKSKAENNISTTKKKQMTETTKQKAKTNLKIYNKRIQKSE